MKKILFTLTLVLMGLSMQAQTFSKNELKQHSGQGKQSDSDYAAVVAKEHPLNEQSQLVLVSIKEYPGQTKKQLYDKVYNWIIGMSSDSKSAIQVADTLNGKIQTRCFIQQIAKRTMGDNKYKVHIRPLLTFDFKDGKVRFTFTLDSYAVLKKSDTDEAIFFGGGIAFTDGGKDKDNQVWPLSACYPYAEKPSHPKVTSSRALINSVAAYRILEEKVSIMLQQEAKKDNW